MILPLVEHEYLTFMVSQFLLDFVLSDFVFLGSVLILLFVLLFLLSKIIFYLSNHWELTACIGRYKSTYTVSYNGTAVTKLENMTPFIINLYIVLSIFNVLVLSYLFDFLTVKNIYNEFLFFISNLVGRNNVWEIRVYLIQNLRKHRLDFRNIVLFIKATRFTTCFEDITLTLNLFSAHVCVKSITNSNGLL